MQSASTACHRQGIRTQSCSRHLIVTAWCVLPEANNGDQPRRGNPMRRLIITFTIMAGLLLPALAAAERVATGSEQKAIDRAARLPSIPDRCLTARVTTKDGGNWANVSFNVAHARSCADSVFSGYDIVHRIHGHWHFETSGSIPIQCAHLGIPVAVRKDLRLLCTASSGPPGARHLAAFLSADRRV
jgi:hypothetical protein